MGRAQTTPQNQNSILMGSAKIEIRTYGSTGAYTDYGLAKGIEFNETITPSELKADNASPITLELKEHSATIKFDMMELDLANIYALRGGANGLDTYATQAAAPVTVTDERHVLNGTSGVRLNYKNGDGTVVTAITVKNASDAAAAQNTDYVLYIDPEGWTCIARVSASAIITTGNNIKISYTYTPLANKSLSSGGKSTIGYLDVKLTNLKNIGGVDKAKTLVVYKAQIQSGLDIKFPAMDSEDPASYPVELKAYDDATRTAGDQLYKFTDEQGV